ncbi:hypothetical protein [Pseudomethylobacillus aquaticus]|nr:hypothetical protein [Pseudomethylobacillus aquaticus]
MHHERYYNRDITRSTTMKTLHDTLHAIGQALVLWASWLAAYPL